MHIRSSKPRVGLTAWAVSAALLGATLASCGHSGATETMRTTVPAPVRIAERECGDVRLPERLVVNGQRLVLNGMAIRRVSFLQLHVFVSGLYLEHEMRDVNEVVATDRGRRLVLRFVRHVSHGQLERGLRWALDSNARQEMRAHSVDFATLLAALPSFNAGDELVFDQASGGGFHVLVNGVMRANFASPEFARLCLLAFIGPHGNVALRLGLVGGHCNS